MKQKLKYLLFLSFSLLYATSLHAITWGEPDGDEHPYVGLIVFDTPFGPSHRCTGTLIAPTVVLTAAHCTYQTTGARIWFDSDLTDNHEYPFGGSTSIEGTPFSHPEFTGLTTPDTHDIGVVILDKAVTDRGFATLLPRGVIDELATKRGQNDTSFTPVGYGLQSIVPDLQAEKIRFHATTTLVNLTSSLTDGYNIHTTNDPGLGTGEGGTCFGDSGGPLFFQDTSMIAGINSFLLNQNCVGAGFSYRVDIDDSIKFLQSFLD